MGGPDPSGSRSTGVLDEPQPLRVLLVLRHGHPAHAVRVPVQELRCRVDDQVGAEVERPLEEGAHERVVRDEDRPAAVRELGEGADVADLEQGVAGGLDPQQVEAARLPLEPGGVGRVEERELQGVVREHLREEAVRAPVDVVRDDHALAGLHEREHRLHGGHARGEAVRVRAAFPRGEVALDRANDPTWNRRRGAGTRGFSRARYLGLVSLTGLGDVGPTSEQPRARTAARCGARWPAARWRSGGAATVR
jgi:hypothetical protein